MTTGKLHAAGLVFIAFSLFHAAAVSYSQTTDKAAPIWPVMTADEQTVAPSPSSASLPGYSDAVVNLSSGQGSLSYGLLSWDVGTYTVSLGLGYRIGAVRTEDLPGCIGLGWTLQGAGSVSRSIDGLPDELKPELIYKENALNEMETTAAVDYLRSLRKLERDASLDRYSYSAPGISGSFVIENGKITELPVSGNKIELTGSYAEGVKNFRITSPDGTAYDFEEREHSHFVHSSTAVDISQPVRDYTAVSTWHLSRIITPEGADTINYVYATMPQWTRDHFRPSQTISMAEGNGGLGLQWLPESNDGIPSSARTIFPDGKILQRITSRTGRVEVSHILSNGRQYISGMTLYNSENTPVRSIELEGSDDVRRQLTSIKIKSGQTLLDGQKFEYYPQSPQVYGDLFGYPNGDSRENASTVLSVVDPATGKFNSKRRPVFAHARKGALRRTESASGVVAEYNYESNSTKLLTSSPSRIGTGPINPDSLIIVGPVVPIDTTSNDDDELISIGIRIASINVTDKATGINRLRTFEYSEGLSDINFGCISAEDFIASSGSTTFRTDSSNPLLLSPTYTTSATMLHGSRLPGKSVESAAIYYGRVTERVSGTGLGHEIKTVYEFDLSDCPAQRVRCGKDFPAASSGTMDNPQRSLAVNCTPTPATFNQRLAFFRQRPVRQYFAEHIGAEARLKSRTDYEYRNGDYQPVSKESYFYRRIDSVQVTTGLHWESLVRSVKRVSTAQTVDDWQSLDDISFFNISVKASRTVCDSVSTIRYFDDGSTRARNTRYLYTSVGDVATIIRPGFSGRVVDGNKFFPVDSLIFVGTKKGSVWQCDSISLSTSYLTAIGSRTYEGSLRYENHTAVAAMATKGFFKDADSRGLKNLPIAQMWIMHDSERADTLLRRFEYGRFAGRGGALLTRQTAIVTALRGCDPIDVQRVMSYTNYGNPVSVTQTGRPVLHYTWGYAGQLLTGITQGETDGTGPSLTATFRHSPLIGCTRTVSPAGTVRSYSYTGSRLTAVADNSGNVLQQYSYQLFNDDNPSAAGSNLITSTQSLSGSGEKAVTRRYFSGFGTESATLTEDFGEGNDVALVTEHDALLRPVRQWVPLPISAAGVPDALRNPYLLASASAPLYGDASGFSAMSYPESADSRNVTASLAGEVFKAHPATERYTCSNPADALRRVTRWRLNADALPVKNGTYAAGELDCTVSTDGDGRQSLMFTDAAGRTVLQRVVADGGEYADTYYITDSWGNPLMVIPPEATKSLVGAGNSAQDGEVVENYCYLYRYDKQLRMTEKKLPGADAHAFAYDCEGRVAFSRDGNQYRCGRRAFTLYDELGRIAVTGTCSDAADGWWMLPSSSRPVMSARRNGQASGANRWGIACGYDWNVQLADVQVLAVNYYDDYGFASDVPALSVLPTAAKYAPKGQPTGSLTAVLGNGGSNGVTGYLLSTSFYDSEERLLESRSQTVDGGLLYASTAYTVGGVPVQTRTQLSQGDVQLAYTNDISVDRHGRPLASVLSEGDNGPSWTLGAYTYNGIGRLSSVIAGGWLSRTMSYDIHGWLTYWESPYIFQTLYYGENGPQNATPSYSGLMTAKSTQVGEVATYTYSYDRMGRLTGAAYSGRSAGEDYSTTYSYDLHSNMLRMTRKGLTAPDSHGLVDDVTATYTGNQLHTLRDDAPEVLLEASLDVAAGSYSADAFDYDANGNLCRDMSRNITSMEYNGLNLPQRATVAGGAHIDWLYTATGQKLRQTVISAAGDTISRRDYVGPYLFTDRQFDRYLTAEGYITADSVYHAYIPDYQGNIVGVVNTAARHMDQFTEYYPYGLPFASSVLPDNNRYKFGTKELIPDLGFNASDFEARTLTSAFPAFSQPDPLAEKYHPLSPYIFCANNPINLIDPTGENICILHDEGVVGHLAMLIQGDDGKWMYYSFNGVNAVINSSSGRPFNDIEPVDPKTGHVRKWNSPQEFLDSNYNREGGQKDKNINYFEYEEGYIIETTPSQDKKMREKFKNIGNETYNPITNNCVHAVIRSMKAGEMKFSAPPSNFYFGSSDPYDSEFGVSAAVQTAVDISKPKDALKTIKNSYPKGMNI